MSALDDLFKRIGNSEFVQGFQDRYGEGKEDYRLARYQHNAAIGRDAEGARFTHTLATNPTILTAKEVGRRLIGRKPDAYEKMREEMGMGLSKSPLKATGQVLGTIGNDLTQDTSRSIWWLLNAPQALANVGTEALLAYANPELFKHRVVQPQEIDSYGRPRKDATGGPVLEKPIRAYQYDDKGNLRYTKAEKMQHPAILRDEKERRGKEHIRAVKAGLISPTGRLKKGVQVQYNKKAKGPVYTKRQFNPGDVASLMIPTGIAINGGIGLLNPLGGMGGYSAVLPSQDDPTKTSNVIGEVAAKYILGRTGNLLPYEEFSKYRPDVSIGDYNRYKAFKYDKEADFNPFDDGQITLPTGVAKFTADGIHGPEVQFLGRSLPVTTALIPYLGALVGGVAGVYQPGKKEGPNRIPTGDPIARKPIRRGLTGGLTGLTAGVGIGLIAEEMRRRANSNNVQLEGGNAEPYLR